MTDRENLVDLIDCIRYSQEFSCYDLYDMSDAAESIADFLISKGVTVQPWISVKDRLPDVEKEANALQITQTVQATDGKETFFGHFTIYKYDGSWIFVCVDEEMEHCATDEITHWIPLHDLPKGES